MDKDRIKGAAEDMKGRVKRQVGEWTGDDKAQAEGTAEQIKGKAQNVMGKMKDAVRDAADDAKREDSDIDRTERKDDAA